MNREQEYEISRCIFREANDGFFIIRPTDLRVLDANPAAQRLTGLKKKKLMGLTLGDLVDGVPDDDLAKLVRACQSTAHFVSAAGYFLKAANGSRRAVNVSVSRIHTEPEPLGLMIVRDVSRLREAEQELANRETQLRVLVEQIPAILWSTDSELRVTSSLGAGLAALGLRPNELVGTHLFDYLETNDPEFPPIAACRRALEGEAVSFEMDWKDRSYETRTEPLRGPDRRIIGCIALSQDITERKQLQQQLLQSQKLEAVGRLAGGVAHDFNNLLTVIIGYSDLLLGRQLKDTDDARQCITEIKNAGEQAASLTRQLLAFSRRQMLAPEVLSINSVVAKMENMLRRLLGENIELTSVLSPDTNLVRVDAGQIEQVVLNLAINARDAMPAGGSLKIETCNVEFEAGSGLELAPIRAGSYVMLAVSDTGCGMDEQTQARIFEPFFTTKEMGRGTGLGLATVYGIIEQSGGHITVRSKVGTGTTFQVYLPRWIGQEQSDESRLRFMELPGGTETILLVEDESAIRALAGRVLRRCGYTVLEAENGAMASHIATEHSGPIHLLLTDVIMPTMGGRELADRLLPTRPKMKTLYISGSSAEDIEQRGVLHANALLLQKPFTSVPLARKVREILDSGSVS